MKKYDLLILLAAALGGRPGSAQTTGNVLLKNATVIDGTGSDARQNTDVLVVGGKIEMVQKNIKADYTDVIDLTGKTVMPSLTCAHAHVGTLKGTTSSADNYTRENLLRHLKKYQDYGVNAVLAMGTDRPLIFDGLIDSTQAGLLPGARLYSAGYGFNTPDPNPASWMNLLLRPNTPEEVPGMMDKLAAVKPAVVKIWVDDHGGNAQKMKPEIYQAIIREAHKRNIRVAAHLFYAEDARQLVQAGIDIIAHSIRDKVVDPGLLTLMKQKDITYIPTLSLDEYQFAYADQPEWLNDPFFKASLEPGVWEMITDPSYAQKVKSSPDFQRNMSAFKTAMVNVAKIHAAGIKVALGTDSGAFPVRTQGFTEHLEMELMVRAGLTPAEVIAVSTRNAAAALLTRQTQGTLEKGKTADFMILSANPYEDIRNTRKIESVWKDGKKVSKGPLGK